MTTYDPQGIGIDGLDLIIIYDKSYTNPIPYG